MSRDHRITPIGRVTPIIIAMFRGIPLLHRETQVLLHITEVRIPVQDLLEMHRETALRHRQEAQVRVQDRQMEEDNEKHIKHQ